MAPVSETAAAVTVPVTVMPALSVTDTREPPFRMPGSNNAAPSFRVNPDALKFVIVAT